VASNLIKHALELVGERTKQAAVTKALQEFIARRRQKRLLDLMGKLEWDSSMTTRPSVGAIDIFATQRALKVWQ